MRRLIVHGGAGRIAPEHGAEALEGLSGALEAGWGEIDDATEAAVAAVRWMEDSGKFNCGRGAVLNLQGRAELDAALMTGRQQAGAVSNLTYTPKAIAVARKVMEETPHVLLCGRGADRFAKAMGFPRETIGTSARRKLYRELRSDLVNGRGGHGRWSDRKPSRHPAWWEPLKRLVHVHPELLHGTVGAVAVDARGRIAAATSTGGIFLKMEGRVSDSSLVGCGTYADRDVGLSATGIGEVIIRYTLTRSIAELYHLRHEGVQAAADRALATLPRDAVGVIALDRKGRFAVAKNTKNLAWATRSDGERSVRQGLS
ncbi:MAG: isoaspartyl peptidase/L-asparaginase [Euryarchaeota archaeon]|nr:isoaspartyl peptidase/L-asparaginase [Euryarchaeota archaeon]MDE1835998.1 isoaspartyl peptidase/L-asparaginase [Euryarchaeota archaeon]MDE1880960.1 isoaspartyl peptidase/L-asparaginase [Euryarchaeota archaeon]MDE2046010.1 isoaspartyl peptidase/L-asparaginase [Thermoplasmata archaeon]